MDCNKEEQAVVACCDCVYANGEDDWCEKRQKTLHLFRGCIYGALKKGKTDGKNTDL